MKIIEPTFRIETPWGPLTEDVGQKLLVFIERQARISHRSEDLQTEGSWQRFIDAVVIQHGDWSVVEHAALTVVFRIDRGITHELVRHRLFSFTQESTRFVNYQKKKLELEFILPLDLSDSSMPTTVTAKQSFRDAEAAYMDMLTWGARPQTARSVLPSALASTVAVTGNLRNWRLFLLMRTSKETHPDFRRITVPLLAELKTKIPILFDDIEPNVRQIDNLRKPR